MGAGLGAACVALSKADAKKIKPAPLEQRADAWIYGTMQLQQRSTFNKQLKLKLKTNRTVDRGRSGRESPNPAGMPYLQMASSRAGQKQFPGAP